MADQKTFMLMVDKRGCKYLEKENVGVHTDYLRANR